MKPHTQVGILVGSDTDLEIMRKTVDVLKEFGIEYEIRIASAHRTPDEVSEYSKTARARGIRIIIAGAGMAAALPGSIAALTTLPVIGVPISSSKLNGIDSALSILQMPPGVPVAGVAIDGAKNAGILAVQILAIADEKLADKLIQYKNKIAEEVAKKNANL